MPQQSITRTVCAIAASANADEVLDALQKSLGTSTPLNVFAAWNYKFHFSDIVYHANIPTEFRKMHQAALKQSNLSPMGKLALTDALPFTIVEALAKARGRGNHPIVKLLRDHGYRDGLYCTRLPWVVAFWSPHVLSLSRDQRITFDAASAAAVYRLKEIMGRRNRPEATLTVRERSVLRHLSKGLDAAQAAEVLQLSENTVRTYLKRAQEKLGANSQLHAVALAIRRQLA
jgi:DNA-binding CsgD family transcriptional regulator